VADSLDQVPPLSSGRRSERFTVASTG